ncbi:MAG: radical SAM protein [bacterium]
MTDFHIQWHLTDRCNLRCLHCYQDQFLRDKELDWDRLKRICDNLFATMDKWNAKLTIALTGGEPLLKEELWRLLEYLNEAPQVNSLSIITNGTIINRYIYLLSNYYKLDKLLISLDGFTSAINDLIRGKGTFFKTIGNIQLAQQQGIPIIVMYTLLKQNIADAKSAIAFARRYHIDSVILERFIPLGQSKPLAAEAVSGEDLESLYRAIFNQIDLEYLPEEMIKYRALRLEFEKGAIRPSLYGAECIVGRDGMAILPDGTVLPCRRLNIPIGNLLETPLDDLWQQSEVLENIRSKKKLKGNCGSCAILDCFGCRAMTYALTGDYLAADPHCWVNSKFQIPNPK